MPAILGPIGTTHCLLAFNAAHLAFSKATTDPPAQRVKDWLPQHTAMLIKGNTSLRAELILASTVMTHLHEAQP